MTNVWEEALTGFSQFVADLRDKGEKDGINYFLSLTVFDTIVESPIVNSRIDVVDTSILRLYKPRAATALYDAVGAAIKNIDASHSGADKIIVVIATDGFNNASSHWDKARLNELIESKLEQGNWSFVYLGTQPETWADAQGIGINTGAVAGYAAAGAGETYAVTADAVHDHAWLGENGTRQLFADYQKRRPTAAGANMRSAGMRYRPPTPGGGPGDPPTKR